MTLDLFGMENAMNNQPTQMLNNVSFAQQSSHKATLFLFPPRNIPDQFRRPHVYKFGGEFRMALQDNMEKAMRGPYNNLDSLMLNVPSARGAILPSAQGQHMNLRPFSDFWTFVLIIDNDNGLSPLGLQTSIPSRMLYSGWIMDEPVTHKNMSAGYVLNPTAILSVTHHTTLTVQQNYTPTGLNQQINTTGDWDYLAGNTAQQLQSDGQNLFDLQPGTVMNAIVADPISDSSHSLAITPVSASAASIPIPTELNAPAYHLQKIVSSMADGVKMLSSSETGLVDVFAGGDVVLSTIGTMMRNGSNTVLNNLDPSKPITMQEIMTRYSSSLNVTVCEIPREAQYDLSSPHAPTKRNVFTTVVASSLPPLLAQFGLAEVAFRFNSYAVPQGGLSSINGERGVFQLLNIATLYAGGENSMSSAWDRLQRYMRMTLFPMLKENVGEFDLQVHCSLAGVSLVNLNYLDDMIEHGLVESNNLLGGLNTPLLGTQLEVGNNASQLFGVTRDVVATGTPVDGMPSSVGFVPPLF